MQLFPYILSFLVFLIILFFVQKFNRRLIKKYSTSDKNNLAIQSLAAALGLQYEELKQPTTKNTFLSVGARLHGQYKNIPIEFIFATSAKQETGGYSYSYQSEKSITLTVKNLQQKHFQIFPKTKQIMTQRTGHETFDAVLALSGNTPLPAEFLEYCAKIGWMNVTLKENTLMFNDTFYEGFRGITAARHFWHTPHPLWGTTAGDATMDPEKVKNFLDRLVGLTRELGLV